MENHTKTNHMDKDDIILKNTTIKDCWQLIKESHEKKKLKKLSQNNFPNQE